jgi:hypothetical protein
VDAGELVEKFAGFTPTLRRFRTMPPTTSGEARITGAPEQFTLIPITSAGEKNDAQASFSDLAPVSVVMPEESILSTVG